MKLATLILTMFTVFSVSAANIATLQDGREVQLNDDFTWQYVEIIKADSKMESQQEDITIEPIAVIPLKKTAAMASVVPNSDKNTLQLSNSGVDVLLGKATYKNNELIIPISLTNQSTSSVISVYIDYEIFDVEGKLLVSGNQAVWLSIKRIADTYLRPKDSKLGKELKIELPNKDQYQIVANITEVESR